MIVDEILALVGIRLDLGSLIGLYCDNLNINLKRAAQADAVTQESTNTPLCCESNVFVSSI